VFRKGVLITGVTASAARDRSYELTFTAISGLRSGTVYRLMKETIS
jgi:type VI secretion system secreted protein VgrG